MILLTNEKKIQWQEISMQFLEVLKYFMVVVNSTTPASKNRIENIGGQPCFENYVHIAAATIYKADIMASWNFKHIVKSCILLRRKNLTK